MTVYIVAVLAWCSVLAVIAHFALPRKERNRLQAVAGWLAFALIYLGNVVAQQGAA